MGAGSSGPNWLGHKDNFNLVGAENGAEALRQCLGEGYRTPPPLDESKVPLLRWASGQPWAESTQDGCVVVPLE